MKNKINGIEFRLVLKVLFSLKVLNVTEETKTNTTTVDDDGASDFPFFMALFPAGMVLILAVLIFLACNRKTFEFGLCCWGMWWDIEYHLWQIWNSFIHLNSFIFEQPEYFKTLWYILKSNFWITIIYMSWVRMTIFIKEKSCPVLKQQLLKKSTPRGR